MLDNITVPYRTVLYRTVPYRTYTCTSQVGRHFNFWWQDFDKERVDADDLIDLV